MNKMSNNIYNNNMINNMNMNKKNLFHLNKTFDQECNTTFQFNKIFYPNNANNINMPNKEQFNKKKYKLNIIYYDEYLKNSKENNLNCCDFKMNTQGTFYGIHHYNLFIYICKRICDDSKIFTLICSGSSADKIFKYCSNFYQINRFYIYCFHKEKYINLKSKYPKLKNIYNNFNDLKSELLSLNDLINDQIKSSNLIYFDDYNRIYIKLHYEIIRKYSLYKLLKTNNYNQSRFFALIRDKYPYYLEIAQQLVYHDENDMIDFFKKNTNENELTLKNVFNKIHNLEKYISNYTIESFYYKYINKFLREGNFDSFRILSNHISKFIYHLYKYKKAHNQNNTSILYRAMYITPMEFENYKNSIGKVICYPAFTSTSLKPNIFAPFQTNPNSIFVKLIINQNNSKSVVCISDISNCPSEQEYLFLPFSFFKITQIILGSGTCDKPNIIYLTAIYSEKPIEEMLLDFLKKETDNLDPEGLKMIKLYDNNTKMFFNTNLVSAYYNNL
jgi:hypothetical protein